MEANLDCLTNVMVDMVSKLLKARHIADSLRIANEIVRPFFGDGYSAELT